MRVVHCRSVELFNHHLALSEDTETVPVTVEGKEINSEPVSIGLASRRKRPEAALATAVTAAASSSGANGTMKPPTTAAAAVPGRSSSDTATATGVDVTGPGSAGCDQPSAVPLLVELWACWPPDESAGSLRMRRHRVSCAIVPTSAEGLPVPVQGADEANTASSSSTSNSSSSMKHTLLGSGISAANFIRGGVSFGSLFRYILEVCTANKLRALHRRLTLTPAVQQALQSVSMSVCTMYVLCMYYVCTMYVLCTVCTHVCMYVCMCSMYVCM